MLPMILGCALIYLVTRIILGTVRFFFAHGNCPRCGQHMKWCHGWATPGSVR